MTFTIADRVRAQKHARRDLPPPERRRVLREMAGLTQKGLAEIVGVVPSAISQYEHGSREPRHGTPQRQRYLELLETLEEEA